MNTRFYYFLVILSAFIVMNGCKNSPRETDEKAGTSVEENYVPANETVFENDRFNYVFELPETWEIQTASNNGDGFVIEPPSPDGADVRIYGYHLNEEVVNEMDSLQCDSVLQFVFTDGQWGEVCYQPEGVYYFREKEDVRVVFSAVADKIWIQKHKLELDAIARSIDFQ